MCMMCLGPMAGAEIEADQTEEDFVGTGARRGMFRGRRTERSLRPMGCDGARGSRPCFVMASPKPARRRAMVRYRG
jgi:hypothetical protein